VADEDLVALVRTHEAGLLRLAYLLCRDAGRAEDLVQDALVRVLRQWRSAGVSDHPYTYTRKVVTNEYLAWRRLRISGEHVGSVDDTVVFDQVDRLADRDLMWRLLGQLPARGRTVLVLRYYEQLTDAEIASILGCRQTTVRSVTARALHTLRAHPMLATMFEEA
jgi:RNA polymerase sigma-70 factor (sigma-E family)